MRRECAATHRMAHADMDSAESSSSARTSCCGGVASGSPAAGLAPDTALGEATVSATRGDAPLLRNPLSARHARDRAEGVFAAAGSTGASDIALRQGLRMVGTQSEGRRCTWIRGERRCTKQLLDEYVRYIHAAMATRATSAAACAAAGASMGMARSAAAAAVVTALSSPPSHSPSAAHSAWRKKSRGAREPRVN